MTNSSQNGIFCNLKISNSNLIVQTKLLNPGDWINFDILFDGEPNIPAQAAFRIIGVTAPIQKIISEGGSKVYVTLFQIPDDLSYGMLLLGFCIVALFGYYLAKSIMTEIDILFFQNLEDSQNFKKFEKRFDSDEICKNLYTSGKVGTAIYALLDIDLKINHIDERDFIRLNIERQISPEILNALGIDSNRASEIVCGELRENLLEYLSNNIFYSLPKGPDKIQKEKFDKIDKNNASSIDLVARAKGFVLDNLTKFTSERFESLTGLLFGVIVFIDFLMIVGGSWRNYISK